MWLIRRWNRHEAVRRWWRAPDPIPDGDQLVPEGWWSAEVMADRSVGRAWEDLARSPDPRDVHEAARDGVDALRGPTVPLLPLADRAPLLTPAQEFRCAEVPGERVGESASGSVRIDVGRAGLSRVVPAAG